MIREFAMTEAEHSCMAAVRNGLGAAPASPAKLAWRRLRRNRAAMLGALLLLSLYSIALFGSFLSTHEPGERNYSIPSHPPTLPRFVDENGKIHFRPFVYGMRMVDPVAQRWEFDLSKKYPIRFWIRAYEYKMWWMFPATSISWVSISRE